MTTPESSTRTIEYLIDDQDRIIAVGGDWIRFARDNEAPELDAERVIGTSLIGWLSGEDMRQLWRELLAACRSTGQVQSLPYRCDSPDLRRDLRMTLTPGPDAKVHFRSDLERELPRRHLELLDRGSARCEEIVSLCSWCKAVRAPNGGWEEIETAVSKRGFLSGGPLPQLSHGICPRCFDAVIGGAPPSPGGGGGGVGGGGDPAVSAPYRDIECA